MPSKAHLSLVVHNPEDLGAVIIIWIGRFTIEVGGTPYLMTTGDTDKRKY